MTLIYRERIPSTDPRLKRHVRHDSRAFLYRFNTKGLSIQTVEHPRFLSILDQGEVGSCTAEAGLGLLGTAFYFNPDTEKPFIKAFGSFSQDGAYRLYSAEEDLDGDGPYPPNDNGSDGLTCAKVLRAAGVISGWTQTFSLTDALKALSKTPFITGTNWYNSMFETSSTGIVKVDTHSGLAGGHEYEVVGYDAKSDMVKFANSWGSGWGDKGFFYMKSEDWGKLLSLQGDVTIFTPITKPAPVPTPPPDPTDPDDILAAAVKPWALKRHAGTPRTIATAIKTWLVATGRAPEL
jgi:hypothetical protein